MKLVFIAGARPNFMKVAALIEACKKRNEAAAGERIFYTLVHTGQHYDAEMSKVFFDELNLPKPDINLGVGSGERARQMSEIMARLEPVLREAQPEAVVVVGDVTSTVAAALVAVKLGIPVAHVEAGLRSYNWPMPEEINRVMTDHISTWLFATESAAIDNLRHEGVAQDKIFFVGNTMIDTLRKFELRSAESKIVSRLGLAPKGYALLTLHRPETVDKHESLRTMLAALESIPDELPIIFPVHPRTRSRLSELGIGAMHLGEASKVRALEPLGYLDFLQLTKNAKLVMTDSGGVQEETTVLGVPCLTLRGETERPVTVTHGTNEIVGTDPQRLITAVAKICAGEHKRGVVPELWDGHAAERILNILTK